MPLTPDQQQEAVTAMREMALFVGCTPEQLASIAQTLELRTIPKNTWVIDEGKPVKTLYLLRKGRTGIYRHQKWKDTLLAGQNPPDFFGEFSMFEELAPTASVKTEEDSEVFVLLPAAYESVLVKHPELKAVLLQSINLLKTRRLWHSR